MEKQIEILNREGYFHSFSKFLVEKWGDFSQEAWKEKDTHLQKESEEKRKKAYKNIVSRLKGKKVAKTATLRSWFGIGSSSKPGREHIFKLALALELSPAETQEYLQRGVLMPGIQINDYREMIFYYGLEKHLSYEECLGMIEVFESQLHQDVVLEQRTHTNELWEAYDEWKKSDRIHFLKVMCENAGKFKGYGKTALNYFTKYKNEILNFVRAEAKERLQDELTKYDFYRWAKEQKIPEEDYPVEALRYLKNVSRRVVPMIDEAERKELEYLHWIAYAKENRNADLLMELYSPAMKEKSGKGQKRNYRSRKDFALPEGIHFPSNSHLSQMLNVALHKEKEIRIAQGLACVRYQPEDAACPNWVEEIIECYATVKGPFTCKDAQKYLKKLQSSQKKQCVTVQREDLLPLIHYVAQRQYQMLYPDDYDWQKAREVFITLADTTLTACQMAPLSEEYELDFLLLSCYRDKVMYTLAEVIEITIK